MAEAVLGLPDEARHKVLSFSNAVVLTTRRAGTAAASGARPMGRRAMLVDRRLSSLV